jgi:hypothetical protein
MAVKSRERGTLPYAVHEVLRSMGVENARLASAGSEKVIRIEPETPPGHYLMDHMMDASFHSLYDAIDVAPGPDGATFRRYEAFQFRPPVDWSCLHCNTWRIGPYLQRSNAFAHEQQYAFIHSPNLFAIRQAGIVFDPAGDEREMRMFAASYGFQVWLGQKPYFGEPIAASFYFGSPEDAGLKGPVKGFTELCELPLIVPAQLPYHVELEGEPLEIKPFRLWAMLCGVMFRAVR